jgi:hypothetical protein
LAWFGAIAAAARVDGFMPLVVILLLLVLNIAGVAVFLIARRASGKSLLPALTMAPLSAALFTAANLLFGWAGVRLDVSGFYDNAGLFAALLLYGAFVSAIGGLIGTWFGRTPGETTRAPVTTPPAAVESLPEISVAPVPADALSKRRHRR